MRPPMLEYALLCLIVSLSYGRLMESYAYEEYGGYET